MISAELAAHIKQVDEEWELGNLYEMANILPKRHGIENVVIWVGQALNQPKLRVKVSNVPNRMDMLNSFAIMMPSLEYDALSVASWISSSTLQKILQWLVLNRQLLADYENGLIDDTCEFLDSISQV